MRVLLLGNGGREHAMAWKLVQSVQLEQLVVLSGSDAIASLDKTSCVDGQITDPTQVCHVAQDIKADLVVIGPEAPLEAGVSDALRKKGFLVLGASKAAAQLETSKGFAKDFMHNHGIPTARYIVCETERAAFDTLKDWDIENAGVVIKADGLAGGKGVVVTHDRPLAEKTVTDFMMSDVCTVNAQRLVIEEKLSGKELSVFALCDGERFIPLGMACDHKRVFDNDEGPNTGGMGCYVPEGWPSDAVKQTITEDVFARTLTGMQNEDMPYQGILYGGLMIDGDTVNVIEFNARFGDPEAQTIIPTIESDLLPLFVAAAKGDLSVVEDVRLQKGSSVHVVMTSEGYPDVMGEGMRLGEQIDLPDHLNENTVLFIAGAKKQGDAWVNTGGRVLGVTALGANIAEARARSYAAVEKVHFNGAHWRKDIGEK